MAGVPLGRSRSALSRRDTRLPLAASSDTVRPPVVIAAIGLSFVAAAVPIPLIMHPELRGQLTPPQLGDVLVGLLLAAPAAVGLWLGLSGLGRISRFPDAAGRALEPAVLRILVAGVLFGHAMAMGAAFGLTPAVSRVLPTAVAALVIGWLILLVGLTRPGITIWLRRCTMPFDIALVSAFLHFGGQEAAGWYPLYLLLTAYAGFRFGSGALVASATLCALGFGAVAATTEFWQHQPALTAECGLALLLLPTLAYGPVRALAEARRLAAATQYSKTRFVAVLAEALRLPEIADRPDAENAAVEASVLPPRVANVLDLAAIEAGTYTPASESFDMHAVLNDALAAGRAIAAGKGIALRARIDPHLPYCLCGWRQSLGRIIGNLVSYAIETTDGGTVQLRVSALGGDQERVRLALSVEGNADASPVMAAATANPFSEQGAVRESTIRLALVRRLAELMGGAFTVDRGPSGRARLTVELGFAIDDRAKESPLESGGCPVLIVTGDNLFAGNISEYLGEWDAPVSWIGEADAALDYIAWLDPGVRAVLVVDGRSKPLAMMSFLERALALDGVPPFALFVAEPAQLAALSDLEDGEVAAFLPDPLDPKLLMNALHVLPLSVGIEECQQPASGGQERPGSNPANTIPLQGRVTPIAAHPRFAAEATPTLDPRRVDALRELGGQEGFLADVTQAFRADAVQIMARLTRAAAVADSASFAQGLRTLGETAGHVGGTSLSQLTASLRGLSAGELREQGGLHLQRLETEIERLVAALGHYLRHPGAQRP